MPRCDAPKESPSCRGFGGVFDVRIDGAPIWSRAEQGRFPEIKELKQLVRDRRYLTSLFARATSDTENTTSCFADPVSTPE